MKVSVIQSDLHWESPSKNREMFDQKISVLDNDVDLIVLPEMFSTGFSMSPDRLAENSKGPTIQWMQRIAKSKNAALAGSIIFEENTKFYNRFIFSKPDGSIFYYDKRHLFRMSGEHQQYEYGRDRVIVEWKGFRIMLLICYDLRFPVWCRNRSDYDLMLVVANFPTSRINAWNTLLAARAIENQCFVIGCNRIGVDGNNSSFCGDSQIIDPLGKVISKAKSDESQIITSTILIEDLHKIRNDFPFSPDADQFSLNL